MQNEIQSYLAWCGESKEAVNPVVVQEKTSELEIKDADSDVILYRKKNH